MKTTTAVSSVRPCLAVLLSFAVSAFFCCQEMLKAQSENGPAETAGQLLNTKDIRKGLCVHVGCGDGKLTAELNLGGKYLVHGLDPDQSNIQKAREYIQSKGIYGPVSVECLPVEKLPYTHDTVNVLVVDRLEEMLAKGFKISEAIRVIAPYGSAFFGGKDENALKAKLTEAGAKDVQIIKAGGTWAKISKPYPAEMDQWEQYKHDASRGGISKDKAVGPVIGIRWIQGNLWSQGSSVGLILSSNGRNFYLKSPESGDSEKVSRIEARDSFNGLKLWDRPVDAGGAREARNMMAVAVGDKVFANVSAKPGEPSCLTALDGATGEIIKTYETRGELTYYKGCMVVREKPELWTVWDLESGKKLREFALKKVPVEDPIKKLSRLDPIIIADDMVFLLEGAGENDESTKTNLICLDFQTGQKKWEVPNDVNGSISQYGMGVLITKFDGKETRGNRNAPGKLCAFSSSGKLLWEYPLGKKWASTTSGVFLDGLYWTYDYLSIGQDGRYGTPEKEKGIGYVAIDPQTGQKKKVNSGERIYDGRCSSDIATEKYILGIDMALYDTDMRVYACHFTRAVCRIGYIAANGLFYQYGHQCICSSFVCGIMGLSPDPVSTFEEMKARAGDPLEKGPEYGTAVAGGKTSETDWPMFRHDAARSASNGASVGADLKIQWKVKVGGMASSPVSAGGLVYVSVLDEHKVLALDEKTGERRWAFIAGGRVDTPPTYHAGLLLFGSHDGCVYCLKADNGELVWKFRAAPEDRRILARDRVESVWPVSGTVLVENGVAYVTAGRHCDADGGVFFYALEPATGKVLWDKQIKGYPPFRTDSQLQYPPGEVTYTSNPDMPYSNNIYLANLNDILMSDGKTVFFGTMGIETATKTPSTQPAGAVFYGRGGTLLCDNGKPGLISGRNMWTFIGSREILKLPSVNCLAFDSQRVYTIKQGDGKNMGQVAAADKTKFIPQSQTQPDESKVKGWVKQEKEANLRMKGVIVTRDKVFMACQPGGAKTGGDNPKVGQIKIYSTENGEKLGLVDLEAEPAFDGMAASEGCLYVTLLDGNIVCLK